MPPSFHPRTVNGPFDDPGLFIGFLYEKRAILFDVGDLAALSPKDILKVSHVFVSHTHMDHFIGFDRLLRILLGRDKTLFLYGPEGFLHNIEGKLAGYSWNLVRNYAYPFVLQAAEIGRGRMITRRYRCSEGFVPEEEILSDTPQGCILLKEPSFTVSYAVLDHNIPCLAFCLSERFHVNIDKNRVENMGLAVGPWLNGFKKAVYEKADLNSDFAAISRDGNGTMAFKLGELVEQIAIVTPGQKIAYVTDAVFSEKNREKVVALTKKADHLFIESCFLEKHRDVAREKYHLTAAQAGRVAREAGVKKLSVFHFSPRYNGQGHLLEQEAIEAWKGA